MSYSFFEFLLYFIFKTKLLKLRKALFGLAFGSLKRAFTLRNAIPPNFEMFGKRQKQFSATRFSPQT
jgi:hypothetical protein